MRLRIACLSHSNISPRQQKFWATFSKFGDSLVVMPKRWGKFVGRNHREANTEFFTADCHNNENMMEYLFAPSVFNKLKEWKPDVIYYQGEHYTSQAKLSKLWARQLGCKYVQFCWETLHKPTIDQQEFLNDCDLIICGSEKSRVLHNGHIVIPQVGIETKEFYSSSFKKYGVLFLGRNDKRKGVEYIKEAYPNTTFFHDAEYGDVPKILSHTKVFVSFPYTENGWEEQWMSYSVAEAMASGCSVVTSDSDCVKEYLKDSPVSLVPMRDSFSLGIAIKHALDNYSENTAKENINFAEQFDNEKVGFELNKNIGVLFG